MQATTVLRRFNSPNRGDHSDNYGIPQTIPTLLHENFVVILISRFFRAKLHFFFFKLDCKTAYFFVFP